MNIPDYNTDLKGSEHKKPNYIKKHWPEFYEYLQSQYPDDSIPAQLYMFYNNIQSHPLCTCGNRLEYRSPKLGFRNFCSVKCATRSKKTQAKSRQTNMERYGGVGFASKTLLEKQQNTMLEQYGVSNAMHSIELKDKMVETNMGRYGVKYVAQSDEIMQKIKQTQEERYGGFGMASDEIMQKIKQTQEERYGGFGMASEEIRNKSRQSNLENYGVEYNSQRSDVILKSKYARVKSIKTKYPIIDKITWVDGTKIYECNCPHPGCTKCPGKFKIYNEQFYRRLSSGIELCTVLLPYQHPSQSNTSVEVFIKMILDKYSIKYIQSDRNIIPPKELDFYLPNHNIAIECNGIYWHSTEFKDKPYHIQKYKECRSKNIQLLSIWEDWVINSPDIVESILLSKLGLIKKRIYARKCVIKNVPYADASEFLIKNHIQGNCSASETLGLYFNDELVSLMSFGKKRPGQGNGECGWELLRFCNKLNHNVIGGASKLLKYFIKIHPEIEYLTSFSANDISNGNLYKTLGFIESGSNQSYWYIGRDFKRYHRFNFNKSKLIKMGNNPELTEEEIMRTKPYWRIHDSGQTKWILNKTAHLI